MLRLLPVMPAVEYGESLYGYVNRLAILNGFDTHLSIYESWGIRPAQVEFTSQQIEETSSFFGTGPSAGLATMVWHGDDRRRTLRNISVPAWMIARQTTRLCPLCLRDGRSHQIQWDFQPLLVCRLHRVRLIDHCGACRTPLRRRRSLFHFCGACCAPLWNDVQVQSVEPSSIWGIANLIGDILDGIYGPKTRLPRPLQKLDLANVLLMARLLGGLAAHQEDRYRPRRFWLPHDDRCAAEGHRFLADWPSSFRVIIDEKILPGLSIAPNAKSDGGRFLQLRFRHEGALPYAQIVASEVWKVARDRGQIPPPNCYGYTPRNHEKRFISLKEAVRVTGVPRTKLIKIAIADKWPGIDQLGKKRPIWLVRSDVEKASKARSSPIYFVEACRKIGCSPTCLSRLIVLGHLATMGSHHLSDRRAHWSTTDHEINDLRRSIRRRISRSRSIERGSTSWNSFVRRNRWSRHLHGDVVAGAASGEIAVIEWTNELLRDLEFDETSLREFAISRARDRAGSLTSLEREFGIPSGVLRSAIQAGLIASPIGPRPEIPVADVALLVAQFATISMLAEGGPREICAVRKELARMGIVPRNSDHGLRRKQAIYRRQDLNDAMSNIAGHVKQ